MINPCTLTRWVPIFKDIGAYYHYHNDGLSPRECLRIDGKHFHWQIYPLSSTEPYLRLVFGPYNNVIAIQAQNVEEAFSVIEAPWRYFPSYDWLARGLIYYLKERLENASNFQEMFWEILSRVPTDWSGLHEMMQIAKKRGYQETAEKMWRNILAAKEIL